MEPETSPTDPPVSVIEPRPGWRLVDLREMWRYRELLYFFTWRDIKIRYKQTVFGFAWAIMQPLATMIIFTVVFGKLVGLEDKLPGDIPYPIFVYAGLLPWQLFSKSMSGAGTSVVGAGGMIGKIYFPRLIIPVASVGSSVFDFLVAMLLLFALMAGYGTFSGWPILLLPLLLGLIILSALSVGIWLSAMTVAYRDFRMVLPFLIQLWMYLTPVIYPVTIIPERWRWLAALNPLTGLIDGFRYCLTGQPFEWYTLGVSVAVIAVVLPLSSFYFRRVESTFADIV